MVELIFTGMCKGCDCADLELTYFDTATIGCGYERKWSVECRHVAACERMEERTIERLTEGSGDG